MAARIDLTFDCADAVKLAQFWKLALGYVDEPPPPPFTTREEWLDSLDLPDGDEGGAAWLCDPDGAGPRLSLLEVPEPKTAKNRLHIDIRVADRSSPQAKWAAVTTEVARLAAAGAKVLTQDAQHHVVMADPEGNEFCVA
jgi:hypothetical protein